MAHYYALPFKLMQTLAPMPSGFMKFVKTYFSNILIILYRTAFVIQIDARDDFERFFGIGTDSSSRLFSENDNLWRSKLFPSTDQDILDQMKKAYAKVQQQQEESKEPGTLEATVDNNDDWW